MKRRETEINTEYQDGFTEEPIETKKRKKSTGKVIFRIFLAILGLILGCALYFFYTFGGTYVPVDIMSEQDYKTMDLSEDDSTTGGDVSSSWADGGHTPLYYSKKHPIIKVDQKDPDIENILVFGVDARSVKDYKGRSDSMIVVSINKKTKSIKLISLMRDSGVYIGDTKDTAKKKLDKLNHAYHYGGVGLMINTINRNFDLDIQRFVMLDFGSAADVIDLVGGIEIDVSADEVKYANHFIEEDNKLNGSNSPLLTSSGKQMLDGIQAVSWARIRYLDSDFVRTSRQRTIANALIKKVSKMSYFKKIQLLNASAGMFETNMKTMDLLRVGMSAIGYTDNIDEYRVPADGLYTVQSNPWMMIIDFDKQNKLLKDYMQGVTK
ncbi:MAG: LCP family protein [Clostridiales bacterium]|nr:LCP family protein [Clostridiales bacterium]